MSAHYVTVDREAQLCGKTAESCYLSRIYSMNPSFARGQKRRQVIGVGACSPVRQAHPFDGFDKLRVCDTAGRLRMTLSGVEGQAILTSESRASSLLQFA